jgi:AcrR family transcriptional regulator
MTRKKATRERLKPRKTPVQRRSAETVAALLEAAARILEVNEFEGFNTNAVAERAGVSIGSLYQYFPNKDALLSGLLERETSPFLAVRDELAHTKTCEEGLRIYIRASVRHQMRRPALARLIDHAEKREAFHSQVSKTALQLQEVMEKVLALPGAPRLRDRSIAAIDLLALIRALIDAAGEREEGESPALLQRVEGAVWGYLRSGSGKPREQA